MVTVNSPGSSRSTYTQLAHSAWNGFHLADIVFPAFAFVMGVSASLALERHQEARRSTLLIRAARRAFLLVLIGVLLNYLNPLGSGPLRYPGVLQRLGLSYLVAFLIIGFLPLWAQVATAGALLGVQWLVLTHLHVPGFGAGVLTSDGNAAGYIDRLVFGRAHMYHHLAYDPEGLLGTAGTAVTALLGAWAGRWLSRSSGKVTTPGLAIAAIAGMGVARWWATALPINKRLWTPSYVLWTAGIVGLALAALWELVEVRGLRGLRHPWVALGTNSLVFYVLGELGDRALTVTHVGPLTTHAWTFEHWFGSFGTPSQASLMWSLVFVAACGALTTALYRRGITLRL